MQREKGLERLNSFHLDACNQHYIVNYFLFADIKATVSQFVKGNTLDIGCGNKPYEALFKNIATNYIGCDIMQSHQNVVDIICPATKLNFENNTFDTVFSTQVIEHVEDHQAMVSEASRVLKFNGIAIFTIPFCWELHEEPYDFFRFSKYGIKYLFEKNGFEIVLLKPNGGKWAATLQTLLNTIFSVRKYKTVRAFVIKHLFITLKFIWAYNKFAVWIDNKYFDEGLTLNYIVVAKKIT
jgi:SAM-dependent methyltransferase